MLTMTNFGKNGRMGNQLFQFAALYNFSKINKLNAFLPLNGENALFQRMIDRWNLNNLENISFLDQEKYNKYYMTQLNENSSARIEEIGFAFKNDYNNFITQNKNKVIDISGYFQTEKYFQDSEDDLKTILGPKNKVGTPEYNKLKESIAGHPETVSIHFRRTDYLNFQHYHTNLYDRTTYYKDAIDFMNSNLKDPKFVFFSDDIDFCIENFSHLKDSMFISLANAYEELWLQSLCDHNIIANSSFSWWGAYLNDNEDKLVTAPKKWFEKNGPQDFKDIYCDNWVVI